MTNRDYTFTIKDIDETQMLSAIEELGFTQNEDYTVTQQDIDAGVFSEEVGTVIPAQTVDEFLLNLFKQRFVKDVMAPAFVKATTKTKREELKALEATEDEAVKNIVVE